MRGKLTRDSGAPSGLRITPACAGKTERRERERSKDEDHPRVCGENYLLEWNSLMIRGSPPRVRGKLNPPRSRILGWRITPACAGKTNFCQSVPGKEQDHPRVCGENQDFLPCSFLPLGSPPRVRGKRVRYGKRWPRYRITPACAGKTSQKFERPYGAWDHPRVCGENPPRWMQRTLNSGSPPRVRGKQPLPQSAWHYQRITPACAGKTDYRCDAAT